MAAFNITDFYTRPAKFATAYYMAVVSVIPERGALSSFGVWEVYKFYAENDVEFHPGKIVELAHRFVEVPDSVIIYMRGDAERDAIIATKINHHGDVYHLIDTTLLD